jgi:hypothetical protein
MKPFCPICASRWGKQLWQGSCICTGHVTLPFLIPGSIHAPHQAQRMAQPAEIDHAPSREGSWMQSKSRVLHGTRSKKNLPTNPDIHQSTLSL